MIRVEVSLAEVDVSLDQQVVRIVGTDLVGPAGATGPTGATGATGATGPAGTTGLTVDGNIATRAAGAPAQITRAALAADPAFTSRFTPAVVSAAATDGVTNALATMRTELASAAGGTLQLKAGTYLLASASTTTENFLTMPANTVLRGAGAGLTTILLSGPMTGNTYGVTLANNITIEGVTIRRVTDHPSVMLFVPEGVTTTNLAFRHCDFDGGHDVYPTQYAHGIKYPDVGTVSNVTFDDCVLRNMGFPTLQTNASTATVTRVRYNNCQILGFYGEGLSFNAPLGTNKDIGISGCRFVGTVTAISFAHVEGAFVTDNYIATGGEGVHIEDYSSDITVKGNTFYECATTAGQGVVEIIDSFRLEITGNSLVNTAAVSNTNQLIIAIVGTSGGVGTTGGGRATASATYEIAVTGNTVIAGPNTAVYMQHCAGYTISGNTLKGALVISSTFVETGVNTRTGVYVFGSSFEGGSVSDNRIIGFKYATAWPSSSQVSWSPGTVVNGNTIRHCHYGIVARTTKSVSITGNSIRRCIHPMIVGTHGAGGNGAQGCEPYTITGNVMHGNQRRASINGVIVYVSTGTAVIGSAQTLAVEATLLDINGAGKTIVFSGGGVFTSTAIVASDAVSMTGNITVANIASGEVGVSLGAVDIPYTTPFTVNNRAVSGNYDSLAPVAPPANPGATGYRAGKLYGPVGTSTGVRSYAADQLRIVPYVVRSEQAFDQLQIEVTTAGTAGTKFRLGIWRTAADGFPGELVLDAGQVAGDAVAVVSATIGIVLPPGTFWLGAAAQSFAGAPALRAFSGGETGTAGMVYQISGASMGLSNSLTYSSISGAFGNLTSVADGGTPAALAPALLLRAA